MPVVVVFNPSELVSRGRHSTCCPVERLATPTLLIHIMPVVRLGFANFLYGCHRLSLIVPAAGRLFFGVSVSYPKRSEGFANVLDLLPHGVPCARRLLYRHRCLRSHRSFSGGIRCYLFLTPNLCRK